MNYLKDQIDILFKHFGLEHKRFFRLEYNMYWNAEWAVTFYAEGVEEVIYAEVQGKEDKIVSIDLHGVDGTDIFLVGENLNRYF